MKYNKPKHFNQGGFNHVAGEGRLSKRTLMIIIAIVAVIAIIVATVIIVSVVKNQRAKAEIEAAELQKLEIKEIQIGHTPDKRIYYCGDQLNISGLTVYSVTYGGKFTELNLDNCTVTGFDSSVPVEKQTITVTYKGFSDTFTVQIKAPESATPMLVSIKMGTLPKTVYGYGEAPSVEGGTIICTYTDGSTKTIALENKHVAGFGDAFRAGVGEHTITVVVTENGVEASTSYKITLTGQ